MIGLSLLSYWMQKLEIRTCTTLTRVTCPTAAARALRAKRDTLTKHVASTTRDTWALP